MAAEFGLFRWIIGDFDTILGSYIVDTSTKIVEAINPVAWILLGIYFVLWGFAMIRGMIQEPVQDGFFRLLKISIVLGFALNVGLYQAEIVNFFMQTPHALANVLAFGSDAATGDTTTAASLDALIGNLMDTTKTMWNQMGLRRGIGANLGIAIAIWIMWTGGLFFTISAAIMILVAKVAMALLLALGPIFIMMVMFESTRRFFEQWMTSVLNYMLTLVLVLAIATLFTEFCLQAVSMADGVAATDPIQACIVVLIVFLTCGALLKQVPGIASNLAGGVALAINGLQNPGGRFARGVTNRLSDKAQLRAADLIAAKASGGASLVAKGVSGLARASNSVRPS